MASRAAAASCCVFLQLTGPNIIYPRYLCWLAVSRYVQFPCLSFPMFARDTKSFFSSFRVLLFFCECFFKCKYSSKRDHHRNTLRVASQSRDPRRISCLGRWILIFFEIASCPKSDHKWLIVPCVSPHTAPQRATTLLSCGFALVLLILLPRRSLPALPVSSSGLEGLAHAVEARPGDVPLPARRRVPRAPRRHRDPRPGPRRAAPPLAPASLIAHGCKNLKAAIHPAGSP